MSLNPPYDGYTVPELRAELETRGLSADGNKPDLVARLEDNDDAEGTADVGDEAEEDDTADVGDEAEEDEAEVTRAEDLPEEALTGPLRRNIEHDQRREAERLAVEQEQE